LLRRLIFNGLTCRRFHPARSLPSLRDRNEAVPFTFRIKLPADFKIPAHSHPAIEHVTVISGTFNIGMGDKLDPTKTQAIPAGGVAIMQPKMNHFAWTKEETILQVHGVGPWAVNYVDPADDPRKK
jgi:hypothetical protein